MGFEAALTAASAGLQIAGAFQAQREASAQQKIAKENARIAQESAQQAQIEVKERAKAKERETKRLRSEQLVGYLKSGVKLSGTPLDVLEETELLGEEDVNAILRQGNAQTQELSAQARNFQRQSNQAKSVGRNALFSGLMGAGSTTSNYFFRNNKLGGGY